MEWDTAAAQAVVEGAGKQCLRYDGGRMEYNKAVMKNPWFIVA
jgi:3'(2'), 5'-bisphosphate nucleotidase